MTLWLLLLNATEVKKKRRNKNSCRKKLEKNYSRMSRIQTQIKGNKDICERKNAQRWFCQDLWNWSLILWVLEKKKVDENGCKYILFKIDADFTEYFLAVEIDKECSYWQGPCFSEGKTKSTRKKLGCKSIRTNTNKEGYDADFEASKIQTFINKFKNRQLKKLNKKLKEL